jgi:hypothetical protein
MPKQDIENIDILYPHGCTMEVVKPSHPLVASGLTSYPVGRPLGALYYAPGAKKGKLVVFGSGHAFTDR